MTEFTCHELDTCIILDEGPIKGPIEGPTEGPNATANFVFQFLLVTNPFLFNNLVKFVVLKMFLNLLCVTLVYFLLFVSVV